MKIPSLWFRVVILSICSLLVSGMHCWAESKVFNIVDYGAVPDGVTLSTAAIQKTIDTCAESGGGTVKVPAGGFLTGTLFLKSHVTLSIEEGGTILGSTNIADYSPTNLIVGRNLQNVAIIGLGTIDGQGYNFWEPRAVEDKPGKKLYGRAPQHYWQHMKKASGMLMNFFNCTNLKVVGVTLQNSESWTLNLLACKDVEIDKVKIRNRIHGPNTDGIDVCTSENVQITNCDIYTGDDAIVLKNRSNQVKYPRSCKNITVANCKLVSPTNGFKIGTETYGDFENIVFRDSEIAAGDAMNPLSVESLAKITPDMQDNILAPHGGITLTSVDGANVKNIRIQNIVIHGARSPIFIRLANRGIHPNGKDKVPPGTLEDIMIDNVVADDASTASTITGIPGHLVKNVTISNLKVTNAYPLTPTSPVLGLPEKEGSYPSAQTWGIMASHSLYLRHVDGISFKNVSFVNAKPDKRRAIITDDAANVKFENLSLDQESNAEGEHILLNDTRDTSIGGTIPQGTKTWVVISGSESKNITLRPDNPSSALKVYRAEKEASEPIVLP